MSLPTNINSPLLQRPTEQSIAWLTDSLNGLTLDGHCTPISQTQFLNHVFRLAHALPKHQHALNLCDNRYLFLVSLCAVIVSGNTNLLPPNKNVSTQTQLGGRYANCLLIHDGACELSNQLDEFDISNLSWSLDDSKVENPAVASNHLAAISFTSGSTGESKPNLKSWRTLVESSKINASHMLVNIQLNHAHLATVPAQHMWGFETSVLLPMFANVSLVDARPFFPRDIIQLIRHLPTPCTLISAPLHLKTLSATLGTSENIELASILCATAPLDTALANTLEQQTNCELKEVYGCSEVGSMAVRNPARSQTWQPFDGLNFLSQTGSDERTQVLVSAEHLPASIILEDQLQFEKNGDFTLIGRSSDQIKIAGKRGSLGEVNAVLHKFSGLLDGVVMFPEQDRAVPRLVALVTLSDGTTRAELRKHMAKHLDSAFVPRPILLVANLPREDNGKLSKVKLMKLYQQTVKANKV